ncbi:c-type cytochrome [Sanyastnella coralliicola]|uniref:c-type cytochrome n=1 Tax=Sanyastnella coralliicola TaxID=3069118 RepID=UPI0027B9BC41|nr:c-type cytochrome [Longitalea sp. SCSIO 12813]
MNLQSSRPSWGRKAIQGLVLLLAVTLTTSAFAGIFDEGDAANGEAVFNANCAACHSITNEVVAAPGLGGISERWGASDELLVKWIQNPQGAAESGDPYIANLVETYVGVYGWMSAQAVSEAEIKDIMAYIKAGPAEGPADGGDVAACPTYDELQANDDNDSAAIWFLILLVLFVIIAISSTNIQRSVKNAHRESEGLEPLPNVSYGEAIRAWAWKNIVFVSIIGLFVTAYVVTVAYQEAMDVGVYEAYEPEQPIKFYHSIHVCENEVDCQYCHSSASKSKHAGIPSTNVCMNCHKGIKKGSRWGEKEIDKIYAAIGFDRTSGQYIEDYEQQPIMWNKVHNLPDHVFFSHQQHVTVGNLECQNCHGDVATFKGGRIAPVEEVAAYADANPGAGIIKLTKPTLTMGWCIECHNKAKVNVVTSDNGYYQEVHDRLKEGRGYEEMLRYMEDEKITVKDLGGWECSKCHY